MEKKSAGLKVLVIVLSVLVVALGGYIVYEKLTNTNNIENNGQNNGVNNEETKVVDKKVKQAITDYLNIFVGAGHSEEVLVDLGLIELGQYSGNELTSDNYRKTDIPYSKFINAIKNYMTEEWFENKLNKEEIYKEKDGLLYYFDGGRSGMAFEVDNIFPKHYSSDSLYIAVVYDYDFDGNKNYFAAVEFEVTKYNDKYVISYCNY